MSDIKAGLTQLINRFYLEEKRFCISSSRYTETEARIEFIDPFFTYLGWDMNNTSGVANSLKDVLREESQKIEISSKRPDYTFRILAQRKFFVEAKRPSVDICINKDSAFQVRRYGWTAGLPISILTNFKTFRVYDTTTIPSDTDDANVGLLLSIDYSELESRFDELLNIFGREAVSKGSIEKKFGGKVSTMPPINLIFLNRFNEWRIKIAQDLHTTYPKITINELNDISQKLINRFIFIRMCEDRGIEGEEQLKRVIKQKNLVELRKMFKKLDQRYNTGLFNTEIDPLQSDYYINAQVLEALVDDLYFPQAPYSFSVLDADFLGQVYELFLTKRLFLNDREEFTLVDKPAYEGREIVATPQPLVDKLVRQTATGCFSKLQKTKCLTLEELSKIKLLDISVGSGRFLLRCLDELIDMAINICQSTGSASAIYKKAENDYRLSFEKKRDLLCGCLYGVDIDFNAVEVARFSLLIKLLEDETQETLPTGSKILPDLDNNIIWGNSVVETDFINNNEEVRNLTLPMNWETSNLPTLFDIIVGNPPYMKTEDIKRINQYELEYYKKTYKTSFKQFDKYFIFIEKAVSRLKNNGWLGMVVPNKWMTIEAGKKLRSLLSQEYLMTELFDFGNELLFEGKSTYVCLLILSKEKKQEFIYHRVDNYDNWLSQSTSKGIRLPYEIINQSPESSWILPATKKESKILTTLQTNFYRLADIADILNGIQTSAEDVFAIQQWIETNNYIHFKRDGIDWAIEKSITRPYLMDSKKGVRSYCLIHADALIIYPYICDLKERAIPISPEKLKNDYPLTWAYLLHYKTRLEKRVVKPEPVAGEFYHYGRSQALITAFKGPKIIYSVNQRGDKYGFDANGIGFSSGGTAGEVSITNPQHGYTMEFILALLHQHPIEYFLRKRGSPFRGGYYGRGSGVISDCPVPMLDLSNAADQKIIETITTLTKKVIDIQEKMCEAIGRSREQLTQQRRILEQQIKLQFNLIWQFDERDLDNIFPVKIMH